MRIILYCLFFLGFQSLFAQYQNYTWPVGAKDIVRFDTLTKNPSTSSRIANPDYTLEGVAVANDPKTGEMLFFHDGHQIFTKNSVVMPGGNDIGGKTLGSTGQGAAIYTIPDCTNKKFIVFSNDADHSVVPFKKGKLYYTLVDMTNGTGTITQAKTLIRSDLDEGMIIINDFKLGKSWLVAKLMDENKFVSIPLSANPSDLTNTSKHIVSAFTTPNNAVINSVYTIRYNSQRKLIALSGFFPAATVSTVQFNPLTGSVSNFSIVDQQALNNQGNAQQSAIADICWSPDGNKLYALTQKHLSLYQYDFNNGQNRTIIIQDPASVDNGGMKIDPSGKIWVINNTLPINPLDPTSSFYVSRIHNPNASGGACNLVMNDFMLLSNGYFYFPEHAEFDVVPTKTFLTESGQKNICQGESIQVGAQEGVQWLWSNGSTSQTQVLSENGSYSCEITFANGCSLKSDTIKIVVSPNPTVDAGEDKFISCGVKVDLIASSDAGNSIEWLGNTVAGATYYQVGQGLYYVRATNDASGCSSIDSVEVIETNGNIHLDLEGDRICLGETTSLTPIVHGAQGTVAYQWNTGQTSSNLSVSPKKTTDYTVTVKDNNTQCTDSKTVQVSVDSLKISLNVSGLIEICRGDSVFVSTQNLPGVSYQWNHNQAKEHSTFLKEEGVYFVEAKSELCSAVSDSVELKFLPSPEASFYINEYDDAILGQELTLSNTSSFPDGSSFLWNLGNGSQSTDYNPTVVYDKVGSFYPNLTITSPEGCTNQFGKVVTVYRGVEEVQIYVPTAFTPNGDGINDVLKVQGIHIRSVEMIVHDRWGNFLFYSPNQLIGWNGNDSKGNPLPTGMYVIGLSILGDDEKVRKFGQAVLLQRE